MSVVYCAWCYPSGLNSPIYSAPVTSGPSIGGQIASATGSLVGGTVVGGATGGIAGLTPATMIALANSFASTHLNDCNVPGSGLWAAYGPGDGSFTSYWLYHAVP